MDGLVPHKAWKQGSVENPPQIQTKLVKQQVEEIKTVCVTLTSLALTPPLLSPPHFSPPCPLEQPALFTLTPPSSASESIFCRASLNKAVERAYARGPVRGVWVCGFYLGIKTL